MKTRGWIFLMTAFLIGASAARGTELPERRRPVRALGTGGVYLPWVRDTDAVLWNPALLNEVSALSWEVAELGTGINGKEMYDLAQSIQNSGCSGSACYSQYYGKPLHVTVGGQTAISMPHFGVTGFESFSLEGTLHNPAFPVFNLTYLNDYGFGTGFGFGLGPGLSGGVTVTRTSRWGGTQDISLSTITSGGSAVLDQFNQHGTAYGIDLALMYRTPESVPIRSSAVIEWQNVGSSAFVADPGAIAPERIKDNLSVGLGADLNLLALDVRAGMEYRQITLQGEQLGKKLHLGAEVDLPLVDVRFGLNQGYPTLGLGLDLLFFEIDLATYSEEVGVYPGQSPSNRFEASFNLSLSFDADFKFTTKDGKKRSLKQRR